MMRAVHIRDVEFNAIEMCVSDAMRCLRTLRVECGWGWGGKWELRKIWCV